MYRKCKNSEFKFKVLPPLLQYSVVSLRGVPRNWEKPREALLNNAKSLAELAAAVVDSQPLPECLNWTTDQVELWVEDTVKLPQYRICFRNNFVLGRQLILLDPSRLVQMSVHRFDHVKTIMTAIRELFDVPMPRYAKYLTLPSEYDTIYDWNTLYFRHIAYQSPDQVTPRTKYWRQVGLLHSPSQRYLSCHWLSMSSDAEEYNARIGRYRKKDPANYWVPMFREGNYVPTKKKLEYFFLDPLRW
ncbi:uncharacterized protein LOC128996159 [Macrosteles quadrilineatus]|uniref:uncharacterized protein LOC128996159 n=1 Tax=Macrosteles quadrilineatus TaxID=74068 RepID=UPI0023E0CD1B|nr:uncharacterized protein LOC128996159 [Macrosteles quadrilineatus]